ncbi:hypothetical protein M8J76_007548 [Diaphorina citri]|nr:hypothetical protein M8J76_007548 [Diaphorina citri]
MNYMEPEILLGTNLQSERQSKDTMINDRGHLILDVMAKYGMIVLNGRVEGDVPGEYTFVGTGGVSTVDLVWVNIQIAERIKKMEVTGKNLNSDHLALYLQLEGYKQETSDETEIETEDVYINKYIWEDEKTLAFTNEIENKTTSSTYTSLQEAIRNVSQNLNLMLVSLLHKLDRMDLWESRDPEYVKPEIQNVMTAFEQKCKEEDASRILNSSYSTMYRVIQPDVVMAQYLATDVPICVQRTLSQLRTAGKTLYLNIKGTIRTIDLTEECTMCNYKVTEDLSHFLTQCPMYRDPRILFLENRGIRELLEVWDRTSMLKVHQYVVEAIKIRSYVLQN